jgi:hypothetical protein
MIAELVRDRDFDLDELLGAKMRTAGRRRVHVMREFAEGSPKPCGLDGAIFRRLCLVDRMIGHVPLSPTLEAVVMIDRRRGTVFAREDAAILRELLAPLEAPIRALARACGYVDAGHPLTPRERDVLRALLTGAAEKDFPLSMTPGALHQRVKDIYAKLGVTSRAELMALWLGTAPAPSTTTKKKRRPS